MDKHPSRYFLFGMGSRRKLVYKQGELFDPFPRERLGHWNVGKEKIFPAEYKVVLETDQGVVIICEDETGVWLEEKGKRRKIATGAVKLPSFEGHPHCRVLRQLHQEILVCIADGLPLPNPFVYRKPWYRDAAMMCMCLEKTGNVDLVREWILSIREPFDRNNGGVAEPDNLGQVLYMVSLVADSKHPAVAQVLARVPEFRKGDHISGLTDFGEHPVYQTKWLKLGLARLGLSDDLKVPKVHDAYGVLFWMDFQDEHVEGPGFDDEAKEKYPYLAWAEDHFHGKAGKPEYDPEFYPMTWEAEASEADYEGMSVLSPAYLVRRVCFPHSWHAAEMFLALL